MPLTFLRVANDGLRGFASLPIALTLSIDLPTPVSAALLLRTIMLGLPRLECHEPILGTVI